MKTKCHHVVLGGTFDHFHKGHQALIDKALAVGKKVSIGIARENLYKNKFLEESIEPYEIRYGSIRHYLQQKGALGQAKLTPINNIFGSSIVNPAVDAIIASRQTYQNTLLVNQKRSENGLPELKIIIVDNVLAADGKLLSSERIRTGEIDREGNLYVNIFRENLNLPDNLREELRKPLGKVFSDVAALRESPVKSIMIITVGDIVSRSLEENGITPDVKIIDFRSRRKPIQELPRSSRIINIPGTISQAASAGIQQAINQNLKTHKKQTIVIAGEEDLLALPAILLAPLNSLVLYGHFELGIIAVMVTEEEKKAVKKIVDQFI